MNIRTIFGYNVMRWCVWLVFLLFAVKANAQEYTPADTTTGRINIKTNLLHDVTSTLNLGAEITLSEQLSLDIPFSYNPWKFGSDRYWKHFLFQPELRYWAGRQPKGHFFGVHAHLGTYNVSRLPDFIFSDYMAAHRFDGWLVGAGVSYGYRWKLNPKWSLEATIGLGYAYMDYDKYEVGDNEKIAVGTYNYFGPTRAGVTLSYTPGGKNTTRKMKQSPSPHNTIVYNPPVTVAIQESAAEPEVETVSQSVSAKTTGVTTTEDVHVASYVAPEVAPLKQRVEKGTAYLDYEKGCIAIDYDFGRNAEELRKIHDLIEYIHEDPYAKITKITLVGHASPEGITADNVLLSADRARALKDHLKIVHTLPETLFTADGRGEDWRTIDSLVAASNNIKKYMILEIIRGTRDADERELRLREEWPDFYEQLRREAYPRLRRIEYEITYTVLGEVQIKH